MFDWHSHILPKMDDGSKSISESLSMLNLLRDQGVKISVATPHFYANDENVESFLDRRACSYNKLSPYLSENHPVVLLGSEVRYYPGISKMNNLDLLRINGTKILLLEMPFSKWTEYTVHEILEIALSKDFTVMLAHIERYLKFQDMSLFQNLSEQGLLLQINASFFVNLLSRYRAVSILKSDIAKLIGSDSHNLTSRPPRIGEAFDIIQKKLGNSYLNSLQEYWKDILLQNKKI